ncbi:hypothetical protein [Fluviicola sp.]|uniref:hypothetical protein n=1 Tax=Fluviicola sp. TaxID=1917219 RepID=UPI0031CDB295
MLRIVSLILAVSFISSVSLAQTNKTDAAKKKNELTGFYGKRFTLQLGAGGHHNTLLKLTSYNESKLRTYAYYSSYRNQIKSDQFNYSLYANLGFLLKERLALSVDFNYYAGNIFLQNMGTKNLYDEWGYYYGTTGGYDARVKYNTIRIMPRIEIASRGSNMPTGLVNVLGLGVELSKLKSGNYKTITASDAIEYNYYPTDSIMISNQDIRFKDESVVNLTVMYGLEYRLAISKSIAWNFGGYVHVNFPIQAAIDDFFGTVSYYPYNGTDYTEEYKNQLSRYRFQNLFSLRTGLVIML